MEDLTFTETILDALERFYQERRIADRQDFFARLTHKNDDLLPFEALMQILQAYQQIPCPEMEMIPLDKIVGSVGRYRDFTRDFRPRSGITAERWARVYRAMSSLEGVPPIDVYQVGDVYFVADGNHRVSAAQANGFDKIAAYVTVIPVDAGLTPGDTLDKAIIKTERTRFLAESDLERLGPIEDIRFTKPGGYPQLAEHIQVHRYFMGLESPHPVEISFQEAAADWYTQVYQPIVKAIRKRNLLQQFPDSTPADLYIWVSRRIMILEREYGQKVSPEDAAATLEGGGSSWQRAIREVMHVLADIADALANPAAGIPEWAGLSLEWEDFRPHPADTPQEKRDE